jgi:hypothetical protein
MASDWTQKVKVFSVGSVIAPKWGKSAGQPPILRASKVMCVDTHIHIRSAFNNAGVK